MKNFHLLTIPSFEILFNEIKVRSKKKNLCEKHSPLINTTKKTPLITSQFFDFKVVYLKNRLMFFVIGKTNLKTNRVFNNCRKLRI